MYLSLFSPISSPSSLATAVSSPTFSLYPHSSLNKIAFPAVFSHCYGPTHCFRLDFMARKRHGQFWVSASPTSRANGDFEGFRGGDREEEDGGETEDEDDEVEGEIMASVLPERWDVLGLGQAMRIENYESSANIV
ncbi:uncharacterized protein LOC110824509 [Carica papaya]|uniref:uncharacterized protein LOC110824509 n=1 Tax=Carica papaya TaxID=3649 RepID=UPI000B8C81F1|nr:uncharacterized protein LOC110824509 [Carica papaya]